MSLPYLQGWGDTLQQNGAQLGQNIAHIVNPNIDFQNMFKAAVAKDPTILQQIANNPGLAQALQQAGLGNAAQPAQNLQVDPGVTANRQFLQSKANVAKGTEQADITTANAGAKSAESKARVDVATEMPTIKLAENNALLSGAQAKLTGTKADQAQREFDLQTETLKKIPTLAGIDFNQLANAIVSGRGEIPTDVVSRIGMDEGATNALKLFTQAAMNRADNAAQMSVALLRKKDPAFQLAALTGLEKQIDDITNQIKAANNTVNSTKPKDLALIRIQARSKDPDIAGPAKQTLQQYDEALKVVNDHNPGSLAAMWTEANAKRSIILSGLGNTPINMGGGSSSVRVKTQTPTKLTQADINQYKVAVKSGKIPKEALQAKIGNGLTQNEYDQIVGGDVSLQNNSNNLKQLGENLFGDKKKAKQDREKAQTQANLNVLLGNQ